MEGNPGPPSEPSANRQRDNDQQYSIEYTSAPPPPPPTTQSDFPHYDPQVLHSTTHSLAYLEGPAPQPQNSSAIDVSQTTRPTRYFEGLASNAARLNISKSDLLRSDAQSPFTTAPASQQSQLNVPTSLQPTDVQRRFAHHPFFDCIPIPAFRDRLVLASSTNPPLINRFDICYDMFAGGLMYRGDPAIEESWEFSEEFRAKWRALFQIEVAAMERFIANARGDLAG